MSLPHLPHPETGPDTAEAAAPRIVAVAKDGAHRFSKPLAPEIVLREGLGVEGDAHAGETVQHRSRRHGTVTAPNLRQVHLLPVELFGELAAQGFEVGPGALGENVTTRGLDLLALPQGTVLGLGPEAQIEVTGLRTPCVQIDRFQPGLMKALIEKLPNGRLVRKTGVMAVVRRAGRVAAGDAIEVILPEGPHKALRPV